MNNYLIPANSKKSKLIFGIFRPIDLGIFCIGVGLTLILLLLIPSSEFWVVIIKLAPITICSFLIFPMGYYHNVRVFFRELFDYLMSRRVYIWKGWCITSERENK